MTSKHNRHAQHESSSWNINCMYIVAFKTNILAVRNCDIHHNKLDYCTWRQHQNLASCSLLYYPKYSVSMNVLEPHVSILSF